MFNFAGKGWYRYEKAGGRIPYEDEEVTNLIQKHCERLGIQRRNVSSQVRARR
jgi:hypothetical protein